jgi:hypothetical protein
MAKPASLSRACTRKRFGFLKAGAVGPIKKPSPVFSGLGGKRKAKKTSDRIWQAWPGFSEYPPDSVV